MPNNCSKGCASGLHRGSSHNLSGLPSCTALKNRRRVEGPGIGRTRLADAVTDKANMTAERLRSHEGLIIIIERKHEHSIDCLSGPRCSVPCTGSGFFVQN